jgi:hypothetical protein
MASFFQKLKELFLPSNKIPIKDFHYFKRKVIYWNEHKIYPANYELPEGIRFPSHFWQRVQEIYRYTKGDEHERAINVWWGDGDVVVTDSLRGERSRVNIPKQRVSVSYNPISPTSNYAKKIIEVNKKVYKKKSVPVSVLKSKKKIEVQFLFNMHTHPPHKKADNDIWYSFFSDTDIKSFIKSRAALTGLVTDEMWLLIKTKQTPKSPSVVPKRITQKLLEDDFDIRVYKAKFGKALVSRRKRVQTPIPPKN